MDRERFDHTFQPARRPIVPMTLLRIGICLLIAFSVLALGAVEVWSVSILEIGAALLFVWWGVITWRNPDAKIHWNYLQASVLGLLLIGLLQLALHGTAYPYLTRTMLLKLAAYLIVLFLATQAFRERKDLERLVWFLMVFGFVVSLEGIAQHFTSSNEIFWMGDLKIEGGDPFGPYVNRNHFAGFVELTAPMGLALLAFRGVKRDLFPLATLLAIVPVAGMILSTSRGGIIALVMQILVLLALALRQKALHGKRATAAAAVALVGIAAVAWVGTSKAVERFAALNVHDVTLGRRASMFRGAARIFLNHPIKGCGLGTIVDVFPSYETAYDGRLVDHVHNDYIEGLAETGLLGGLCGVLFLWTLYTDGRERFLAEQGHFSRGLHAGAIMAVSGLLLHSFVDFNLQIPANALLFLLQAYLVTAPALPPEPAHRRRRQAENFAPTTPGA